MSLGLSVSISVCLSVSLSLSLSIYLSIFLFLGVCVSCSLKFHVGSLEIAQCLVTITLFFRPVPFVIFRSKNTIHSLPTRFVTSAICGRHVNPVFLLSSVQFVPIDNQKLSKAICNAIFADLCTLSCQ